MDSKPNQQMTNRQPQFGATNSADVKLRIFGPNREEYEGNPLHLHSEVLQKSDFFKTLLSDRWSPIRPFEKEVITSQSFENYLKCIEMMYSSTSIRFSNIDECLTILSVASELLVDKLMKQCMRYLEAIPWNSEQESNIRNLLCSLNLNVLPDLKERLNKQKNEYIDFVVENFKAMISFLSSEDNADEMQPNIREAVDEFIIENLQEDETSGIADICRHIILEEFESNVANTCRNIHLGFEEIRVKIAFNEPRPSMGDENWANKRDLFLGVVWPFNVIERCDGTTMEGALKILCEKLKPSDIRPRDYVNNMEIALPLLPVLLGCLEALGKGKIIVERKLRSDFVTTWLPVMAELIPYVRPYYNTGDIFSNAELKTRLCRGVISVIETLPFDDWRGIYKIWIDCCKSNSIDLSIPFRWGCKILQKLQD